jgi:hypothetical protein
MLNDSIGSCAAEAPSYLVLVGHGTGVGARVLINDLPIFRGFGQENMTVTQAANHLLLPGDNTMTMELFPAPRPAHAPSIEGPVVFTLRLDVEEGTILHRVRWPDDMWEMLPDDERVLPFAHTSRFVVDERLGRPVYWDKPPVDFPLEGNPALHAAVTEFISALQKSDVDAFMDVNSLKLAERQRANHDRPELATGDQKKKLVAYFSKKWLMRPTSMDDLVFENRAGGRVAYVTRKDGGRAVEAVAADDPTETFAVDLFLTRHEGRWRVFR